MRGPVSLKSRPLANVYNWMPGSLKEPRTIQALGCPHRVDDALVEPRNEKIDVRSERLPDVVDLGNIIDIETNHYPGRFVCRAGAREGYVARGWATYLSKPRFSAERKTNQGQNHPRSYLLAIHRNPMDQ